ncbi:MAG: class I SAM-dependent methyltransferase [Bacteroidales bacterium]|nr:class I SAM-dependent methyltransferase [Bacteroidales bacterium]MCF6341735.1 class I SAM-dependent methyltransferase [Bacteroidales bacterium]
MYKDVGIEDIRGFYKNKFAFKHDYDFTKNPINFYHIDNFKLLWMFSNIKENTKVLDFGCGSGVLACLKRKGCEITGIDYSETALEYAKKINRYDYVLSVDIFDYDNYNYFDYIVSIDVFGHIPFEDKDKVIAQLKRFLKPGGTMLHGIECGQVDYAAMSKKELKKFIEVDGHVGIEGKPENTKRFKKSFKHVSAEVRFDVVNSVNEFIKQNDSYGNTDWGNELITYLKNLTEREAFAFNVASGITQISIENRNMRSSQNTGGFLFLKASDNKLEHRNMEIISRQNREIVSHPEKKKNAFFKRIMKWHF